MGYEREKKCDLDCVRLYKLEKIRFGLCKEKIKIQFGLFVVRTRERHKIQMIYAYEREKNLDLGGFYVSKMKANYIRILLAC